MGYKEKLDELIESIVEVSVEDGERSDEITVNVGIKGIDRQSFTFERWRAWIDVQTFYNELYNFVCSTVVKKISEDVSFDLHHCVAEKIYEKLKE